ncbi:MAG TPA: hypothetical protein VLJ84_11650 [Usitatibacter sp.]|nr:hypothetical protein [Usitatibacter sp.]HST02302.1 hypothetical protein [Usitatibacter sp.]
MDANPASLRSHPLVIIAIMVAALAVVAFALVGIAYMMGWLGHGVPPTPASIATPGQQLAGTAPDMGLLPGESLVTMPEPPRSAIPPPAPEGLAVPVKPSTAKPAYVAPPAPSAAQPPPRAAVTRPSYEQREAREEPREERNPREEREDRAERTETTHARIVPDREGPCVNCGTITAIATHGEFWDIDVRYEDGSTQTLRYPERPRLRPGQRVRFEDGRLVPDRGR